MKTIYLSLFTLFTSLIAYSQDKLYKKGGEVVEVKVLEVGTGEVKYKLFSDPDGPAYAVDRDQLIKIVYKDGRTEIYQSSLKDPALYADQAKSAIKINFLSPLLGYTQLNFEHSIRPGRSYEIGLGIIGLGKQEKIEYYDPATNSSQTIHKNAAGVYLNGGYKFMRLPDFVRGGTKYTHVLQGFYAKPEIISGVYSQNVIAYLNKDATSSIGPTKETVAFGGLILNLGKQWILGELLTLDIYGGVGYAIDNQDSNTDNEYYSEPGYHYGLITNENSGLGITGGIKLGLLINKKHKVN
ncbi:hypothetical protein GS399_00685 [Pedobacter sp. HMF7647]|uniref:DUF3575 domain-containing protein n=1 Tax=Hufsiella arboris TaxID=2695275 RepID=A0A7K1Y540_9SPHI|nr:hypothetical protein [Hufsiella arboris]MXV49471.1 hypothetical protein [Hufsiella arboris]